MIIKGIGLRRLMEAGLIGGAAAVACLFTGMYSYREGFDYGYRSGYANGVPNGVSIYDLDKDGTEDILITNENEFFPYLCPKKIDYCVPLDEAEEARRAESSARISIWRTGIDREIDEILKSGE